MSELKLEKKKYNEDASPEIIKLIKSRVTIVEDNIILLKEIPTASPFSVKIIFDEIEKLSSKFNTCGYLIDLNESNIPDSETRQHINERFKNAVSNVQHVSFVTGKNFIINTAARFVMYQTKLKSFSICKTLDEGVLKIKEAIND